MSEPFAKELEDKRERFFRLLPDVGDATLIVLKGHLLIEEQLNDILYDTCLLPKYIDDARLSFYQKIMLVRSLIGKDLKGNATEDPWRSLVALNSVRNQLAHHLEPTDVDDRIDKFIFARFGEKKMVDFKSNKERVDGLRKELCLLFGYIHGYWIGRKSS
jgi:hypothetical protein